MTNDIDKLMIAAELIAEYRAERDRYIALQEQAEAAISDANAGRVSWATANRRCNMRDHHHMAATAALSAVRQELGLTGKQIDKHDNAQTWLYRAGSIDSMVDYYSPNGEPVPAKAR